MTNVTRMPGRIRRLNPEPFLGMEAGIVLASGARPPWRTGPRPAWALGLLAAGAFVSLLAIVAVNEEFTALQEQLARERRAAALWTACRLPAPGERLTVEPAAAEASGGPGYTCTYEAPRRRGSGARLAATRGPET
ncbi:MAG: hypothetical protein KJ007_02970 [Burkholderiales bacterium]|nr:hypothetical protein [Burkholderiales bacterium]